jgi:hypothetical protein
MVTKELIKEEIDSLQDEHLEVLYRFIKTLEIPTIKLEQLVPSAEEQIEQDWPAFVEKFAGCLREAQIERGAQGEFEQREELL